MKELNKFSGGKAQPRHPTRCEAPNRSRQCKYCVPNKRPGHGASSGKHTQTVLRTRYSPRPTAQPAAVETGRVPQPGTTLVEPCRTSIKSLCQPPSKRIECFAQELQRNYMEHHGTTIKYPSFFILYPVYEITRDILTQQIKTMQY